MKSNMEIITEEKISIIYEGKSYISGESSENLIKDEHDPIKLYISSTARVRYIYLALFNIRLLLYIIITYKINRYIPNIWQGQN